MLISLYSAQMLLIKTEDTNPDDNLHMFHSKLQSMLEYMAIQTTTYTNNNTNNYELITSS